MNKKFNWKLYLLGVVVMTLLFLSMSAIGNLIRYPLSARAVESRMAGYNVLDSAEYGAKIFVTQDGDTYDVFIFTRSLFMPRYRLLTHWTAAYAEQTFMTSVPGNPRYFIVSISDGTITLPEMLREGGSTRLPFRQVIWRIITILTAGITFHHTIIYSRKNRKKHKQELEQFRLDTRNM